MDGIKRYCCNCANGNRTIGCCSHIAAVIYYLSYGRYLSKIIRPAEVLTKLFHFEEVQPVIEEDIDEDQFFYNLILVLNIDYFVECNKYKSALHF